MQPSNHGDTSNSRTNKSSSSPHAHQRAASGEDTAPFAGPHPPSDRDHSVPAELLHHARYEIFELLGVGGMGAVFKARHRLMDRFVAIKVIVPALVEHAHMVA